MNIRHYFDVFYNKYYLPTVYNRWKAQRQNRNQSFSLICGNCMGGYIYHQLGLPFLSPTINLVMSQLDLFKLASNLRSYQFKRFKEGSDGWHSLDDIKIFFTHYPDFESGANAWYKRFERVNYKNLYIIATDRDGITEEHIRKYGSISCKKVIVFTAQKYPYPWCFQIEKFKDKHFVGNILGKTLDGRWRFEHFFDFVGWLNSDDSIAEHFKK